MAAPLISASTMAALIDLDKRGTLDYARAFGVGGQEWTVKRLSGTGVGPKTSLILTGLTAYVYQVQFPGRYAPAQAGQQVLTAQWFAIVVAGPELPAEDVPRLLAGDVITSVADARYRYTLKTPEPWYDEYLQVELERYR